MLSGGTKSVKKLANGISTHYSGRVEVEASSLAGYIYAVSIDDSGKIQLSSRLALGARQIVAFPIEDFDLVIQLIQKGIEKDSSLQKALQETLGMKEET